MRPKFKASLTKVIGDPSHQEHSSHRHGTSDSTSVRWLPGDGSHRDNGQDQGRGLVLYEYDLTHIVLSGQNGACTS